jgi:hypothetical protein
MPKYHTRYVKEHYVKRDIKRELYEAFIEWCGERSINICLEKALSILRGNVPLNVRGNMAPNAGANQPKTSPDRRLESATTSSGNVASTGGGYEWCKPRSSIKNLEGYVKYLERSLGLEDWWEEDDKICFKTRRKPAKTD